MKFKVDYLFAVVYCGIFVYIMFDKKTNNQEESTANLLQRRETTVTVQTESPQSTICDQYDLMMNIVANPTFALEDFVLVGINKDNVTLRDISVYRNDPYIRSVFTEESGYMNEMRFQGVYHKACEWMKRLNDPDEDLCFKPTFHRDNIDVPYSQRRKGPDFQIIE
ncbi:MAG: hypothetical protein NC548_50490 [Lachnospiraceae bacterium]|nr:hypothetical protein [Lachnospiraceae bacterium]